MKTKLLRPVFEIDGTRYVLVPGPRVLKYVKKGPQDRTEAVYQVTNDQGTLRCTCPGYRKWGRCKHRDSARTFQSLLSKSLSPRLILA